MKYWVSCYKLDSFIFLNRNNDNNFYVVSLPILQINPFEKYYYHAIDNIKVTECLIED
jgi:hypothetical protein